ncbi:MAG TPA: hypothetical protein VFJ09_17410, partial [Nocardioidaceae bacterium]|nr:hypothetical protein [Nocardioidaceae bacterium]
MLALGKLRRSRLSVTLAVAALGLATLVAASASDASSPTEGTVSDTSPTTSWGGGPFVAGNVTAQVNG